MSAKNALDYVRAFEDYDKRDDLNLRWELDNLYDWECWDSCKKTLQRPDCSCYPPYSIAWCLIIQKKCEHCGSWETIHSLGGIILCGDDNDYRNLFEAEMLAETEL